MIRVLIIMFRETTFCVVFVCYLSFLCFGVKGQINNGTTEDPISNNDTTTVSNTTSTTESQQSNNNPYPYPYYWPLCDLVPVVDEWPDYPVYDEPPGPVFEEQYPLEPVFVEPQPIPVYFP